MGLLDLILGGAGNVLGRSNAAGLGRGGGGRSNILMALLPVVLGMLSNRGGGAAMGRRAMPGAGLGTGAGGLSSLGGLGAALGAGGLGELLQRFQQSGYGDQVQSWIGTGANQPLPQEALSHVFEDGQLSQIASQAGVSEDDARAGLSELLPQVVDHFTPQGQLPEPDQLISSLDDFDRELQQRI